MISLSNRTSAFPTASVHALFWLFTFSCLPALAAEKKSPSGIPPSSIRPGDDAASINNRKEARRVYLAKEIARHQAIMDKYDNQNSFALAQKKQKGITREQYDAAKAARDKCQHERNELTR
jgi:hypothetical protein